jgi:hypothetical protein
MITEVSETISIQLNGRSSFIQNIFIKDLRLVHHLIICYKIIHYFLIHFC